MSRIGKSIETEAGRWWPRAGGGGNGELVLNRYGASFGVMEIL